MVKRTSRELQRDLSIYTLISLALVIPVFAAIYFDWNFEAAKALFAIGVVAVSVVGMQAEEHPRFWKSARGRRFLLIYLPLHVAAFYLVFRTRTLMDGRTVSIILLVEAVVVGDIMAGKMRWSGAPTNRQDKR